MKLILALAALLFAAAPALSQSPAKVQAQSLAPTHPLLGTWRFAVPGGVCTETYTFRADGTRRFLSAEEVGESTFLLADTPSDRGFYRYTDTVTKTNGKPDCSGNIAPMGIRSNLFILFHPRHREEFIVCRDETLAQCFGPVKKEK